MLEASAIAPDVIAARGYFTATTKTALEALGFGRAQRLPGLVIPVYNVHGDLATYVLRPDVPRIPSGKNKPAKYEFMYGARMTLDVPRLGTLHQALGNPQIPLWITEGSKKVDSLASQGCCTVAVLGVWNWRGTNDHGGTTALPDWEAIALDARTIYVVYDSDVMLKDEVHQALARIGAYLAHRKAHVRYLYLPAGPSGTKIGIDDYLAQGHTVNEALDHASTQLKKPVQDEVSEGWHSLLQSTVHGEPRQTLLNVGLILHHHAYWQQEATRFWYDEARGEYMSGTEVISEEDVTRIGEWLGQETGMTVTNDKLVSRSINVRCMNRRRDLLKEELDALPAWDGVERLDHWLADCASVARTAYGMAVSRLLPVSMVARAYAPGCQYRYVVVLCGLENTGKTKLLRYLGGSRSWFAEISSSLESKEAHILLRGIWLAEFSELESIGRTGENRLKSYITMEDDYYIPKFSNRSVSVPRRTIFVGTTNESEFLKGQTGNTRYLPIQCGEIVPEMLPPIRAQVFAEAKMYYRRHVETWWQLEDEAHALANVEREARREKSIYEDRLASTLATYAHKTFLDGGQIQYTVWYDLIVDHLGILPGHQTPTIQRHITNALRALGWTYSPKYERVDHNGATVKVRPWKTMNPSGDDP